MADKKVTIAEVAKRAGVSKATISKDVYKRQIMKCWESVAARIKML